MNATMNAPQRLRCMLSKVSLSQLCGLLFKGRRAVAPAPETLADSAAADSQDDDAPRACGWFDSSHDLQQGLRVQEHLNADSLVRELPLGAWLELQLGGWRAATPAGVSPAFTHAT